MSPRPACRDCGRARQLIRVSQLVELCATCVRNRERAARARVREQHRRRTYGLTSDEHRALLAVQGGRCAICAKATGATKALAVDHDHGTGLVRGLLCGPCNTFIGRTGDDAAVGQRLHDYLVSPPAKRLGIEAVYAKVRDIRRVNGAVPSTARPDPALGAGIDPFEDDE